MRDVTMGCPYGLCVDRPADGGRPQDHSVFPQRRPVSSRQASAERAQVPVPRHSNRLVAVPLGIHAIGEDIGGRAEHRVPPPADVDPERRHDPLRRREAAPIRGVRSSCDGGACAANVRGQWVFGSYGVAWNGVAARTPTHPPRDRSPAASQWAGSSGSDRGTTQHRQPRRASCIPLHRPRPQRSA